MADRHQSSHKKARKIRCLFSLLLILLFLALPCLHKEEIAITHQYSIDYQSIGNPLMGYAPQATKKNVSDDITLLYVDITWRELEPEKGIFAFEEIAQENQLARWREEGKHIVLRFLCDLPSDEQEMDIPDWLYEETGDGVWYDISYGKGYSPDYSNPVFIENHARAIAALGKEFGNDTFICYIELGSLGHWGEWHVKYSEGLPRIPKADIREYYITPWLSAFPHAKIMMRRPFQAAKEYGFGLFNDMCGHTEDTEEWLSWIAQGGDYSQAEEKNALAPMPDFWKSAPSGGELTSSVSMEEMLSVCLEQTVSQLCRSHTTFLGPKIADASLPEGYAALLRYMGYRLYISEATLSREATGTRLTMLWGNAGVAPIYWDWPTEIYVLDEKNQIIETAALDIRLSRLLPGSTASCSVLLKTADLLMPQGPAYRIAIGIIDPMTGLPAIRLDMNTPCQNGMTMLFDSSFGAQFKNE